MPIGQATRQELLARARSRLADVRRMEEAGLLPRRGEFFPSVLYPPITMYPPSTAEEMLSGYVPPSDGRFDVYAHIPFCEQRCTFCWFPGKYGAQDEEKERYLTSLDGELTLLARALGVDRIRARTILVAGGSPTHLGPEQLRRFLRSFLGHLDTSGCTQFSLDVDPASIVGADGLERLRVLREAGVQRLTVGVESLDETTLQLMNRPHGVRESLEALAACQALGFRANIDFIYGHPGQTVDGWMAEVEAVAALGVDAIQLYRLWVVSYGDSEAPMAKYARAHPERIPSADDAFMMKQIAIDVLERAGYRETIPRVYARPGGQFSEYQRNEVCALEEMVGVGLSAESSLRDRFYLNTPSFEEYHRAIAEGRLPVNRGLVRGREEQVRRALALPIKMRTLPADFFERRAGVPLGQVFRAKIGALCEHGLLTEDARGLHMTPLGAFFADELSQQFYSPRFLPFPQASYADGPLHPYRNQQVFG